MTVLEKLLSFAGVSRQNASSRLEWLRSLDPAVRADISQSVMQGLPASDPKNAAIAIRYCEEWGGLLRWHLMIPVTEIFWGALLPVAYFFSRPVGAFLSAAIAFLSVTFLLLGIRATVRHIGVSRNVSRSFAANIDVVRGDEVVSWPRGLDDDTGPS